MDSFLICKLQDIVMDDLLLVHGQHLFDKIFFGLPIFLNNHPHIPARIQGIVLLLDFIQDSQFAQAGHVFIYMLPFIVMLLSC